MRGSCLYGVGTRTSVIMLLVMVSTAALVLGWQTPAAATYASEDAFRADLQAHPEWSVMADWPGMSLDAVSKTELNSHLGVYAPIGFSSTWVDACDANGVIVVQPGDTREWGVPPDIPWAAPAPPLRRWMGYDFVQLQYVFDPGVVLHVFKTSETSFISKVCGNMSPEVTGTLTIIKYDDSNMNGQQDAGESDVTGWPVSYSGPASGGGSTPFTVQVSPGSYSVGEGSLSHWLHTTPTSATVDVSPGGTTTVRFGNVRLGSVTVRKFDDADMDGVKDATEGDPGFPVKLWGTAVNGVAVAARYGTTPVTFADLPPGDYHVCENVDWTAHPFMPGRVITEWQDERWMATTPTCIGPIHLGEGEDRDQDYFGNVRLGSVAGIKWDDTDCDHQKAASEAPLEDWTITLTGKDVAGDPVAPDPMSTASDGTYMFEYLPPADVAGYTVSETLADPAHWGPTTPLYPVPNPLPDPVSPQPYRIVLLEGEEVTGADFANVRLGMICGFKFYDASAALPPFDPRNGNGRYDPGEPLLSGWRFTLNGICDLDVPIAEREAISASDGTFCFPRLYPSHVGDGYTVREEKPAGWILTAPQHLCRSTWLDEGQTIDVGFEYGNLKIRPLGARTIGYWKTHPQAITAQMYAALNVLPAFRGINTWKKLYPILDGANAVDMKVMLRAHLLGLTLNVLAGIVPSDTWVYIGNIRGARDLFGANIVTVQYVLDTIEGAHPWTSWTRAQQETAKNVCDAANNNANLVSPTP